MNKKVITSSVLTALMMGGFSGVQAADLEARVVVLETAVQGLGEKVGAMDPGAVAAEKTAREDGDKALDGKITAEAKAREDGDKALDGKIIDLTTKVSDETAAREAEDKKIREEFAAADQALDGKITTEETARKAEDGKLDTKIEAQKNALGLEITNRETKDKELDEKITAEAKAREAKEAELAGKISDEKDDREAKDTELANDIKAEKTAREAADQDLRGKIDDINTTLNNGGIAASAEATEKANKAAEAAQKVADEMSARQDVQDIAIDKNRKDIDKNIADIDQNKDDIKNLKRNKADAEETKAALEENKNWIAQESKDRKRAGEILTKAIEKEVSVREAEDKKIRGEFAAADKEEKDARIAEDKKIRGEFAEADKKLDEKITAEAKVREDVDKELEKKLMGRDNALAGRIDKLATDTDKGLAKVSALAGLHPLDYDPANKLNLAAAGGFYNGENAVALGAFYRPNRNVMLSFGASLAGGDNAYNVGVSVKVGKGGDRIDESNTTVSELYYLVGQLQDQIAEQQRKIEELEAR